MNPTRRLTTLTFLAFFATVSLLSGACSMHALTGDTMAEFSTKHVLPRTLQSGDIAMACANGMGQTMLMEAFGRVTDHPHRTAVTTYSAAGTCAEAQAWEAELRRMRAIKAGQVAEAKDARIVEQMAYESAAKRNHEAFSHLESAFGAVGQGGKCPKFEPDSTDKLIYFIGLTSGAIAVVQDRSAGGAANVPMSIPKSIMRATDCLRDSEFWGAPTAMRAAVWVGIPGSGPEGNQPWKEMARAADMADEAGVGIVYAMWIQSASSAGNSEEMCSALERYENSLADNRRNKQFLMLDAYSRLVIRHEVNKNWVQAVGHRAPTGVMSCYQASEEEDDEDDDLLGDLLEEAEAPAPTPAPEAATTTTP